MCWKIESLKKEYCVEDSVPVGGGRMGISFLVLSVLLPVVSCESSWMLSKLARNVTHLPVIETVLSGFDMLGLSGVRSPWLLLLEGVNS